MMTELAARIQKRRRLIEMARRRQKAGSGSATAFLQQRTVTMQFSEIGSVLSPVLWAVVGAAATRLYMPERMTSDLNILIDAQDAAIARERLTQAGAIYQGELSIGSSSWILPDGFPMDVLEGRDAWVETAIREAQTNRDAANLPVLPLPYLVLMKFQSSRMQDLADITRMLGLAEEEQRAAVRAVFARWQPEEQEDLESLIALGMLEFP